MTYIVTYANQSDTEIIEASETLDEAVTLVLENYLEDNPKEVVYLVWKDFKAVAVISCLSYNEGSLFAVATVSYLETGATTKHSVFYLVEGDRYVGTSIDGTVHKR